jgi:hypothetical protein
VPLAGLGVACGLLPSGCLVAAGVPLAGPGGLLLAGGDDAGRLLPLVGVGSGGPFAGGLLPTTGGVLA